MWSLDDKPVFVACERQVRGLREGESPEEQEEG
jgi:hypothetical protein